MTRLTGGYVPCGQPGAFVVKNKDPNPYVMCAMCADHNVKNRGAKIVQVGEKHKPIAVIDASPVSRFKADAKAKVSSSDALSRIVSMIEVLEAEQNKVAIAADVLRKVSEAAAQIENVDLPELLKELRIKKIELPDDRGTVELIEDLKVGISTDNKAGAFAWVRKKGDGGIIKVKIVTDVGNDADGEAEKLAERIGKVAKGRAVTLDESIHYQTLKAYVKEQREKGVNVPTDLFGIHVFNKAKLTPPKKRK